MRLSLLWVLLLVSVTLVGQSKLEGFYIDMSGDTIYGSIMADINSDLEKISFFDANENLLILTPANARSIQGPLFGKLTGGLTGNVFVQTLMEGKIDVHRMKDTLILVKDGTTNKLILSEKSANAVNNSGVTRNQQLGAIKLLTFDGPADLYKANEVKLNYSGLTNLFRDYNIAMNALEADYTKLNKKLKFSWGILLGAGYTSAAYNEVKQSGINFDPYEIGHLQSIDKNFGISLKFRNVGRYHRIAFETSPHISLQNLTSNLNYNTTVYNNDITNDIKMTSLNVPLIFNYSIFNTDKSYLYLNGGFNAKFNFNTSYDVDIVRSYLAVQGFEPIREMEERSEWLADAQYSPIVGLSYLSMGKAVEFEAALRYQYVSQYMRVGPGGVSQNVSLTLYVRMPAGGNKK